MSEPSIKSTDTAVQDSGPFAVLRESVKHVPQMKVVFGVVAMAAGGAIIAAFHASLIAGFFAVVAMVVLSVFALLLINLVDSKEHRTAATIVLYVCVGLFALIAVAAILGLFFNWPIHLQDRVNHL